MQPIDHYRAPSGRFADAHDHRRLHAAALLQGLVLVGAFLVVIGNLAADLVLGRLDPRLRGAQ
jgi:ABC-type dipeptide/oligopeptide/nickel transport system permease component